MRLRAADRAASADFGGGVRRYGLKVRCKIREVRTLMSDSIPSSPPAAAAPKPRVVNRVPWWTYVVLAPASVVLRLWLMSLRMHVDAAQLAAVNAQRGPVVICLWHNRLFIAAELRRRYRSFKPQHGLVSASKDGAWLVAFFNLMGIGAVRGSSSWRGGQATVELEAKLRAGHDIVVTPDGPRGPIYDFKKGPALLALRRRVPVFLVGADFGCAKSVRSWDRFKIPAPFSRVTLKVDVVLPDTRHEALTPEAYAAELRERLLALTPADERATDMALAVAKAPRRE